MNIVFDIGGTKMRFAAVVDQQVLEPIIIKTPESYVEAIADISDILFKISKGHKIDFIVGGIAGVLSKDKKSLLVSPNLKSWVGRPIEEDLSRISGAKVVIRNDTDMVGLGEAILGAGKGYRNVAYLTFSTGIGGTLIVSENLLPNNFGFEPGFQIIESNNNRSLHSIAGSELKNKYGLLFKDIKSPDIRNSVMKDVIAGIHNTIIFWSPDVVVLGGGMTESFDLDFIKNELLKIKLKFPEIPEIKFAKLDDMSGLIGSNEFIKKFLNSKIK